MNQTLRQFLKELFTRFVDRAQDTNLDIEFNLSESLLTGSVVMSSTKCPFALVSSDDVFENNKVRDLRVFVLAATKDPAEAFEIAMTEGTPNIVLPFTTVDLNDSTTYDHLYQALIQYHPFTAARHLKLFSQQTKPE